MIFKEKGYDEYLAEKEKKGLQDSSSGNVYSLEQANAEWQKELEDIICDLREFEREVVYG